jgi:NitT/TauT family transport system substrate-binding protein
VKFVEASLSQVPDLLKSGQVDASVMADPFYPRLIQEKSAVKLGDLYDTAPPGVIIAGFSATRKWTEKNRAAIAEFRAALEEAAQFVKTHDPMARESMGKYMKLGPEVVAAVGMPSISTRVDASSLGWLLDVMYSQSLLQTKIDLSTLIAK